VTYLKALLLLVLLLLVLLRIREGVTIMNIVSMKGGLETTVLPWITTPGIREREEELEYMTMVGGVPLHIM
jgi:hypothetical protein